MIAAVASSRHHQESDSGDRSYITLKEAAHLLGIDFKTLNNAADGNIQLAQQEDGVGQQESMVSGRVGHGYMPKIKRQLLECEWVTKLLVDLVREQ